MNLISEKVALNREKFNTLFITDNRSQFYTKSGFRKFIMEARVPLTRYECHILYKILEDDGKIYKIRLQQFLDKPYEFNN